jgi:hypothetical protein
VKRLCNCHKVSNASRWLSVRYLSWHPAWGHALPSSSFICSIATKRAALLHVAAIMWRRAVLALVLVVGTVHTGEVTQLGEQQALAPSRAIHLSLHLDHVALGICQKVQLAECCQYQSRRWLHSACTKAAVPVLVLRTG